MITTPPPFSAHEPEHPFDLMLIDLYLQHGRSVDNLAYTEEFDRIYKKLHDAGDSRPQAEVFRRLLTLRKSGRLPRIV